MKRRRARRGRLRKAIPGVARLFLYDAPILNFANPSGTLRFGTDQKPSLLDPTCRAHQVQNLDVADAPLMPTSTGENPSLRIADNALRVADVIAAEIARPRHNLCSCIWRHLEPTSCRSEPALAQVTGSSGITSEANASRPSIIGWKWSINVDTPMES